MKYDELFGKSIERIKKNRLMRMCHKPTFDLSEQAETVLNFLLSLSLTEQASVLRYLSFKYEYDYEEHSSVLPAITGICDIANLLEDLDNGQAI